MDGQALTATGRRKMRAGVFDGRRITSGSVDEPPEPGPVQLTVQVRACGICGSDLSMVRDPDKFVRVAEHGGFHNAVFDPARPVVPGHEFAGVVVQAGALVEQFAVGDRVTGIGIVTDPATGLGTIIGYSNEYPGAFSERIVVDAAWVRKIPDNLSFAAATLAEPLHVGEMHAQWSGVTDQDAALVVGAGPVGLGTIYALAARACPLIAVVEPSPRRRALAAAAGAHLVSPPDDVTPVNVLPTGTDRRVVAFECSGRPGAIATLLRTLPQGSVIQVVGSAFDEEAFSPVIGQWRQILINFGNGELADPYGITLARLADGIIDPSELITDVVGLDDIGSAFEQLGNPGRHVKIIVDPSRG